ncbi:conserved hypothetical protein [Vibrio crassostreae]|nr:hypothetical protein [Vibrio crassostreae]CAK2459670.1 conserved hypothetical protein [Vibrio crassostreae]CAK2568055.1 conserved hypothetical protein [Vibrio crassostreae]CAK2568227.1 conserved hypothetical protein [Vibrio crassostreae]CAK2585441.1 conserved hypothetical protein [Vibrio crassostreae]
MLQISRKCHQSIHIVDENNNVVATITVDPQRRKGQTSLGIGFRNNYKVFRDEKLSSQARL